MSEGESGQKLRPSPSNEQELPSTRHWLLSLSFAYAQAPGGNASRTIAPARGPDYEDSVQSPEGVLASAGRSGRAARRARS